MKITAFQITKTKDIPFQTEVSTLDEMTRALPQGFYTTFSTRSKGTKVFGLRKHLQRLYMPAKEQGIVSAVSEPALRISLAEFATLNLPTESRIRLIMAKNNGAVYAGIEPFTPIPESVYRNGVKVISTEMTRQAPHVKDTGFISSSIAQRSLIGGHVFEILLTKNEKILEGMTSNFYAVRRKMLVTARNGILPGVTRRVILRLASGQGMSIDYRAPHLREKFDEAFLTSSSRGVVPIISIDEKSVGQGRVGKWTKILSKAYQTYVEERSEKIIE